VSVQMNTLLLHDNNSAKNLKGQYHCSYQVKST